jgi:tetraacyldisaccharide 4'-kinase
MALIAFCGIARPERFFRNLREHGADVREEIAFRDHHRYSISDVSRLVRVQQQISGARFVTTEKDSINLGIHFATLNPVVIPMSMSLLDPETAIKFMLSKIAERSVCDLTA